jgi:hypothetical protein
VVIEDTLAGFRMIATEALHRNAPEYMIPGVLRHYDIPDLIQATAPRTVEFLNLCSSVFIFVSLSATQMKTFTGGLRSFLRQQ